MRKLFLTIAAVTLVSAVSLSSHRAEATMPAGPTAIQAAAHAANSMQPVVCVMRRVEYDGGAPRAWAEGFARLNPNKPPADVPPRRWLRFIDDCGRFLDGGWAARATALGCGPLDLFGCDRERPFARVDHLGLLWLVKGGNIVELHRDRAILETESSVRQTYRRRPVEVGRVVLAWELSP